MELKRAGALSYREAVPAAGADAPTVVLLHGFPESSLMWEPLMGALSDAGRRCLAPDLYCLGESEDPGPATFERNVDALDRFLAELEAGPLTIVVHDWGGFVGLAWACENRDRVEALVISDTGFFSDGRWHGMAEAIRAPGGEAMLQALDRDAFTKLLAGDRDCFSEADVDAYWKPFESGRGREATVEFYRSMDMEKLARWDGCLTELAKPALILWGAEDRFAPIGGAYRFEKQIPDARFLAIEGAGHFVFDEEPERTTEAVVSFLSGPGPGKSPAAA